MRSLSRFLLVAVLSVTGVETWQAGCLAAPPASSYVGVQQKIDAIRQAWSRPGANPDPNAPGWNAFFDVLSSDLTAYSQATTSADRLTPLNRIYQMSVALGSSGWSPGLEIHQALRQWLRPRVRLAWAERQLDDTVRSLPVTSDPSALANRQRWVDFVENDLGKALRQYDSAANVSSRQAALKEIYRALDVLQQGNQLRPWQPSANLQAAINDLFIHPNLDVTADVYSVSPLFNQNLVTSGPVYRKGYWSQVTAGPKTGFGLMSSDDGIAFYNSQLLSSSTPITDFQNQIAADRQGRRAAKMYQFSATSFDQAELFVTTILTTNGLQISPSYRHAIDAQICSTPAPGGGLTRLVASLIGFNQTRINNQVYQQALPQFQQRIPQEAQEEGEERTAAEAAKRNADLRQYLIGNNMAVIRDFLITGLSLRSRPEAAYIGGLFQWRGEPGLRGADAPQPAALSIPESGITADLHLNSVLTGAVRGLFQDPRVQGTQNVMLFLPGVPAGSPAGTPPAPPQILSNVDYPTFLRNIEVAQKSGNAGAQAIRIRRPSQPPEFAADAKGNLVIVLHDLQIEAPAPPQAAQGGGIFGAPTRVVRFDIPEAEVAISYLVNPTTTGGLHVSGKVEEFTPSPKTQVSGLNTDESKPSQLNAFSGRLILAALIGQVRNQKIDRDLQSLPMQGVALRSISPLDPTGWVRINLVSVPQAPAVQAPPVYYQTAELSQEPQPVYQVVPAQQPVYQEAAPVQVQIPMTQTAVVTP